MNSVQEVPIAKIVTEGLQARAAISEEAIGDYADQFEDLPPIGVCEDRGTFYVFDGHHRLAAAKQLGKTTIRAEVHVGTKRDAFLRALKANTTHGLRRTNEDKRRAVHLALQDPELSNLTVRAIAKTCGVSHTLVENMKSETASLIRPHDLNNGSNPSVEHETDEHKRVAWLDEELERVRTLHREAVGVARLFARYIEWDLSGKSKTQPGHLAAIVRDIKKHKAAKDYLPEFA